MLKKDLRRNIDIIHEHEKDLYKEETIDVIVEKTGIKKEKLVNQIKSDLDFKLAPEELSYFQKKDIQKEEQTKIEEAHNEAMERLREKKEKVREKKKQRKAEWKSKAEELKTKKEEEEEAAKAEKEAAWNERKAEIEAKSSAYPEERK